MKNYIFFIILNLIKNHESEHKIIIRNRRNFSFSTFKFCFKVDTCVQLKNLTGGSPRRRRVR